MARRVLLVDDHEPWRRQIRTLLRASPKWRVVGEAACGIEAVAAAATFAQDLILLAVALPHLNGLEAARRILSVDPAARILFVSSHRAWEIAETAFAVGGRGYVLKSHSAADLPLAMEAVDGGSRFISPALVGLLAPPDAPRRHRHRHEACFYSRGARLVNDFATFAAAALTEGKSVIVATLATRRPDLERQLQASADLPLAIRQGRYLWADQADLVAAMTIDGRPDETRFWTNATSFIMQAARTSSCEPPRVAACGEGTGQLLAAGRFEAVMRLEQLFEQLAVTFNVDMLCGFPMTVPHDATRGPAFDSICAGHTAVRTIL